MSGRELAERIEARAAKATPGPWEAHQGVDADKPSVWDITSRHNHTDFGETPKGWFVATVHEVKDESGAGCDAALIVTLVNAVPEITAALRRVEALEAALLRIECIDYINQIDGTANFERLQNIARAKLRKGTLDG